MQPLSATSKEEHSSDALISNVKQSSKAWMPVVQQQGGTASVLKRGFFMSFSSVSNVASKGRRVSWINRAISLLWRFMLGLISLLSTHGRASHTPQPTSARAR
jgi:hypothetical protein